MFSREEIDRLISGKPLSDEYSFDDVYETEAASPIRAVCRQIEDLTGVKSRHEFDYGEGFASFVAAWFYFETPDWAAPRPFKSHAYQGLCVTLSRLSPYFIMLEGNKEWDDRGSSGFLPDFPSIDDMPTPVVREFSERVQTILEDNGWIRLHKPDLAGVLSPDIEIDTNLSDLEQLREFDALFYWWD